MCLNIHIHSKYNVFYVLKFTKRVLSKCKETIQHFRHTDNPWGIENTGNCEKCVFCNNGKYRQIIMPSSRHNNGDLISGLLVS